MSISYEEFRERVNGREFNNFRDWGSTIQNLEELYDTSKFVFFYAKNLFNDSSTELIIFLESGLLIVTRDQDRSTFNFDEYHCKVASKNLTATRYKNSDHELKIVFDNGKELTLHNVYDSNHNWDEEYAKSIRELYKVI
jgi:hypothetical protein